MPLSLVRMMTSGWSLQPSYSDRPGDQDGGWPLRGIKATLVALISLRGNPFQRKRNDGIDLKHDCSEKRLPVDSIGIFSSSSSTPGPSCQAGLLPAAAAATPGTGFHIHRCVNVVAAPSSPSRTQPPHPQDVPPEA